MRFEPLLTQASAYLAQTHGLLAEAEGGGAAGKEAATKEGAGGLFGDFGFILPFLLIAVLFYLMLIRPQRKKQQQHEEMMAALKKNDRVVTAGGIIGIVTQAEKDKPEITIRVDENNNTRLKVMRSSVVRVLTGDEEKDKEDS